MSAREIASMNVGYIGLGAMGSQLARQLLPKTALAVWDLNPAATAELARDGATVPATPAALAAQCQVILLCLPRSADVERIVFRAGGLIDGLQPGTIVIDQTSGVPEETRAIANRLEAHGVAMLDAPVAGGIAAAAAGRITIMASGERAVYERALPVLEAITTTVVYCGERLGDGQAVKAINNVMNAACRLVNLEAIAMGLKAGLALAPMIEAINRSSGRSRISEVALPALLAGKPSSDFSLALMIKDVDQAVTMGMNVGAPMAIGSATRALLQAGANLIGPAARLEDMIKVIASMAGVPTLYGTGDLAPELESRALGDAGRGPVIGYIGLGAMGLALARKALQASRELHVFDVDPARVQLLVGEGAIAATDLATLARRCDVIMICVPTSDDVRQVLFGPGGLHEGLSAGKIVIDQTTSSPAETVALGADLEVIGVALVDAPVAGGPHGAADGTLLTLCGGAVEAFARVEPILKAISGHVIHFGPIGSGHAAKLVKNALGATNRLITYESLAMGLKIGVPLEVMARVIGKGSGWTAALDRVMQALRTGRPTVDIRLGLLLKDLRLVCDLGVATGVPLMIPNVARTMVESAVEVLGPDVNIDQLGTLFGIGERRSDPVAG